jgi:AcrR family transcriptional regulator
MSNNGGRPTLVASGAPVHQRRKVGRPPKLNRQMIAEAAHEVGLTGLTMKAVADRLGVSVPGLYHHVDGKEDLLRLTAEYSAARLELPEDRRQHWAVWLYEWAHYNRDAFVEQPELLKQFIEGAIGADRTAATYEKVLTRLVHEGFSATDAARAYFTVSQYAVGAAINAIREARATAEGRPMLVEFHRVLALSSPGDFPHLRALVAEMTTNPDDDGFVDGLRTILRGLAESRGERWSLVSARLRRAETAASHRG